MKKILALLISLLIGAPAFADSCATALIPAFSPYQAVKLCDTFVGTETISGSLTFTTTGPIIQATALSFAVGAASTPNIKLDNTGVNLLVNTQQIVRQVASVITPATDLTPTAGARLSNGWMQVATAAPTAVYMFARPTLSVGKTFTIYHQGASPLNLIPEDGAINAAAALTPFIITTGKTATCEGFQAAQMICRQS